MATEDEIIAEREGGLAPPKALSYQERSQARSDSISLPDTTGETSADFQARTGATVPQGRETFFEAQSRGREQRIAGRSPFNAPFTADQRGNRTAIEQGAGEEGQRFTVRPPSDVRNILTNGAKSEKDVTRIKRFAGTSAGKNFDFGQFNQSLAQLRRNTLGPKEFERQMDSAFRSGTPAFTAPPMQGKVAASRHYGMDGELLPSPPIGVKVPQIQTQPDIEPVDDILDSEDTDSTMAFNDFRDYTTELLA